LSTDVSSVNLTCCKDSGHTKRNITRKTSRLKLGRSSTQDSPTFWEDETACRKELDHLGQVLQMKNMPSRLEMISLGQEKLWNAMCKFSHQSRDTHVQLAISQLWKIPVDKINFEARPIFVEHAYEWKEWGALSRELMAFSAWYSDTVFRVSAETVREFDLPSIVSMAGCLRPDLNYAILRLVDLFCEVEHKCFVCTFEATQSNVVFWWILLRVPFQRIRTEICQVRHSALKID